VVTFRREDRDRVATGEITVTFRLWKSAKVKSGKAYCTGIGTVEIEDVQIMPAGMISKRDVPRSGCRDVRSIWELAGEHTGAVVGPNTLLYRVQFRVIGDVAPGSAPTAIADLDLLAKRLPRMDALSSRGAWTIEVLRLIERNPQVPARTLAAEMGWETLDFKPRVRRLKALGLTISHEIGYELSELGRAYLASISPPPRSGSARSPRTRARSRS